VGRLFQAFELVDASASRRHAGTGLGLCISRHLCRLMGGDVTVATAAGEGSEFTATFRVEPVAGAAGPAEEMEEERRPLEGVRVLLIEDGPDNQRLLRHVLTRAGADVDVRADGPSGLGRVLEPAAGEWAPDVILMDVQMPGMDGYEATRRLRKAGVRTPIVALTAHAMMGERERCLLAGCDDYQTKPIDRARLLACCKRRAGAAAVARAGEHASARA
jgi:CheY-like chemotaxis protein